MERPSASNIAGSSARNVVLNPDFSRGLESWRRNCCEHDFSSRQEEVSGPDCCKVSLVSDTSNGDHYYASITNRSKKWQGLEQDITCRLSPATTYRLSALVGVSGLQSKVEASLRLEHRRGSEPTYLRIGKTEVLPGRWVKLEGEFVLQTLPDKIFFYLEGPSSQVELRIKAVTIIEGSHIRNSHQAPDRPRSVHGSLHQTQPLKQIFINYNREVCTHNSRDNYITITFDSHPGREGACCRSTESFLHGTFGAKIQCPKGDASGLVFAFYLSTWQGSTSQDEIDFEFLGKKMTAVHTNYYIKGESKKKYEKDFNLGFDCSDGLHEYVIKWDPDSIEWWIDGKRLRKVPVQLENPMYLYFSVWDGTEKHLSWTGPYRGGDVPYLCLYKDIVVPAHNAVG